MIDVTAYIKLYMNNRGYEHYTIQPEEVYKNSEDDRICVIGADNEFYFLMSNRLEAETVIDCDTNVFVYRQSNNDYRNSYSAQVFTGLITITMPEKPDAQIIEFLRVIPVIKTA